MKFLIIAPRYHTNLHYIAKALKTNNHSVEAFVLYQGISENYQVLEPKIMGNSFIFKIFNFLFNNKKNVKLKNNFELKFSFPPIIKFIVELVRNNPDVLMIRNIESLYSVLALLAGRLMGKKNIVLLQIDKYRSKEKSYSVEMVGKFFKAIVITPLLGDAKFNNKNTNLHYVPFTIDSDDFQKNYFMENRINILSIGKFTHRKNQKLLISAVKELNNPDIKLTLVGQEADDDYLTEIYKYINENNLQNRVEIKLNLSHEKIPNEYKKSDLFILPSYSEPASISILEAMRYKLPVISSDDNGTKCYISHGVNGYIFHNNSLDDLLKKIRLIINDKKNIKNMGESSYEIVINNHSFECFNKKLNKYYD